MLTLRKFSARRVAALASALWFLRHLRARTRGGGGRTARRGSTFIAPLMDGWINYFENLQPDINIRYDAIGSGKGGASFEAGGRFCGKRQFSSPWPTSPKWSVGSSSCRAPQA